MHRGQNRAEDDRKKIEKQFTLTVLTERGGT